jgi:hypothetical protein
MKDIKDYLPFYTGCDILVPYGEAKFCYIQTYLHRNDINVVVDIGDNYVAFDFHEVKPILRPLSDITEEECNLLSWSYTNAYGRKLLYSPEMLNPEEFKQLLVWGFDLFGLIEAGLAIDKTTLEC